MSLFLSGAHVLFLHSHTHTLQEYAAFIKLRWSKPELSRPYKVPLSNIGCVLFLVPTFALSFFVMSLATLKTYIFTILANAIGILLYNCRGKACCKKRSNYSRVANAELGSSTLSEEGAAPTTEIP